MLVMIDLSGPDMASIILSVEEMVGMKSPLLGI